MEEVLECAATGNLKRLKILVFENPTLIDAAGPWTITSKKTNYFIVDDLTPLIVAASHGNLEVVSYILSFPNIDVNRRVGSELTTALHSAASSRSPNAVAVVRMLLAAGADPNMVDSFCLKPSDVALANPNLRSGGKKEIVGLLCGGNYNAIKNPRLGSSITNDSVMYTFKVHPCKIQYYHDWKDCAFFHPEEKARRRDPRMFHYSCEPCPNFKAGSCTNGNLCKYAHGTFEIWLHPLRYKTKWCKDGAKCSRKICFFAHSDKELRVVSDTTFNPALMVHNVPTLHFPTGDMGSMLSPRGMRPLNLDDSMNFHNVPFWQGMINQPAFRIDGRNDVVAAQIAQLGEQFHNMELGNGDEYEKTENELLGDLFESDPEWKT